MPAKLIQISGNELDIDFGKKLARGVKFDHVLVSTAEEFEDVVLNEKQTVVLFDVDEPKIANQFIPIISKYVPSSRVFALSDKNLFELPHLNRLLSIGHYCVRNYSDFGLDWISKIIVTLFFKDPFDLQYYVDPGVKIAKILMTHSHKKGAVIDGLTHLLSHKSVNHRCMNVLLRSVDELIMNAMFDAPVDDKERPYRRAVDRNSEFHLFDREEVEIQVALNTLSMVICVQDQFGSFSKSVALNAMQKDYTKVNYQTDAHTKSAGLGLHGIAGSGVSMLMNVKSGKATQAILSFPYFKNYKEMKSSFRSFSLNII